MEIIIDSKQAGERIDSFVSEVLKEMGLTRTIVQEYISKGCTINGKECKRSYRLKEGDIVSIDSEYWNNIVKDIDLSKEILPQKAKLDVRYEDENLMVLYKPKGVVVHPGVGNPDGTLANYVRYYLESKGEYDSLMDRCGVVHRLDKGVSGLILFAKSKNSQEYLRNEFKKRNVIKIYHAYLEESNKVEQNIDIKKYLKEMNINLQPWKDWQKVEGYIGRDIKNRYRMEFKTYEFSGSRYALSYILFSGNEALVKIDTGRMHQIRVTLKYLGYHIKGDSLYGSAKGDSIMLEAVLLSFVKQDNKRLTLTV